jgi:hypothetical protein
MGFIKKNARGYSIDYTPYTASYATFCIYQTAFHEIISYISFGVPTEDVVKTCCRW